MRVGIDFGGTTIVFGDGFETPVVPARHGDSSGVRGAAGLRP